MASHKEIFFFFFKFITISTLNQCQSVYFTAMFTVAGHHFIHSFPETFWPWSSEMKTSHGGKDARQKLCFFLSQSYHCHGFHDTQKWFHQFTDSLQPWKKNRLKGLILQQNSCRKASKPASIFYTPYVCVFFHFIVPCIKFRSPFLGKAQQLHEQLHTHISVCSIFVCPNNGMAANAWNVMHVMAHASALTL